jgi:predicted metalloprotease with PDZ domain
VPRFFLPLAVTSLVFVTAFVSGAPKLGIGLAQERPDPYSTGVLIAIGAMEPCPIFIGGVTANSPAEQAGVGSGDRLLEVDGKEVQGMPPPEVVKLLQWDQPGQVTLKLWHMGKEYEALIQREKLSSILAAAGMKEAGGRLVPLDTTDAEVKRMMEMEPEPPPTVHRVFPLHYPLNTHLYYGGFEILILEHPPRVAVGGLEHGPAFRAGIHLGDVILSVNGVNPVGESREELEALFSSNQPKSLTLVVDRVTTTKTIEFQLEMASEVLKENHRRLVNGILLPDGMADEDLHCITDMYVK